MFCKDLHYLNLIKTSAKNLKFNPSKATILAWPCLGAAYLHSSKPCGKHRGYTYRCLVQAPLCVQTSPQDPRPLAKRYSRSQVLADPPASPRRHMGFFKIAQNLPQISFKFRQAHCFE